MNKKEIVIETARKLFSTYGYKKVSMDEIARKSGVTKKTIYTYFKDKNDLIKYFLYDELNEMKNLIDEIDKKDLLFVNKIHETIISLMDYRVNSKLLGAFSNERSLTENNLTIADECSNILTEAILKEIKTKLEYAIENDYIKPCDPEMVSFIIYKVYIALMFEWNKPVEKKKTTDMMMDILTTVLFK